MENSTESAPSGALRRGLGLALGLALFIGMLAFTPPEGMTPTA
jgi:hypothetical protein